MAKSKAPYPHPKIFGLNSYAAWLQKAERELERFKAASTDDDRNDCIVNFATSISQAIEWAFAKEVDGKVGWSSITTANQFRDWLAKHCEAIAKIETVYVAAKHPILHSHAPQIDAGSASTTGSMSMAALPTTAVLQQMFEGATIEDIRWLVVGGTVVDTTISWSVPKLFSKNGSVWFHDAARDALKIWKQFDPQKGETQTLNL